MRPQRLFGLLLAAGSAVGLTNCSGDDPKPIAHCEVDLAPYLRDGSGAKALVAGKSDLLAGEAASGRAGDLLLRNDRIQVLIQQPNRTIGPQPYGGNIIDADILRDGEPARDSFGEVGPLFQFGRTVDAERVEVLRDGSDGKGAVVVATGRDTELDFIHLPGMIDSFLPGGGLNLPDVDQKLNLRVSTYYVLNAGDSAVRVVSALCNDGKEDTPAFGVGDLVDSGGEVGFFSAGKGRFDGGAGMASLLGGTAPERFVAWVAEHVAYGYVPPTDDAQALTVAGVTGTLFGKAGLTDWLGDLSEPPDGSVVIEAGKKAVIERDFVVAPDVAGIYDHYYARRSIETGRVEGTVTLSGQPAAGARIAALQGGKVVSVFTADAAGAFAGQVPPGETTLVADDWTTRSPEQAVQVAVGQTATAQLALAPQGRLDVAITDRADSAIPAKVTVICDGPCPTPRSGEQAWLFRDTDADKLPVGTHLGDVFEIRYLEPNGKTSIPLPAGSFRVFASRGPEWTLESSTVVVTAGETASFNAKLAHVVDTAGWVSGDMHVHAINSPDAPVGNLERLRTFLAEGVDVLVATDHDFVTDLEPWLAQIPNGSKWLKTVTGVELTTFDYGHYNGFPLVADPEAINGGAPDWAGGRGPGLTPKEIFSALHAYPGDQVVQLNHPRSGFFQALGVDTSTMWTRTAPEKHRIRHVDPDPATGDTRLFDDGFTAMEIQNGYSPSSFAVLVNDWFSLLSRGFKKTATAVSDTHKRHGDAGYPRTYVQLAADKIEDIDAFEFARAVNAGRAFGTNGAFLRVTVQGASGDPAGIGDTLKLASAGPVTVRIEARTAPWMALDKVSVFMNTANTETLADGKVRTALPQAAAELTFQETTAVDAEARTWVASASLDVTKDSWITTVFSGGSDLFPVVGKGGEKPLGFSNAVYVDVGGDGWTPPVSLEQERQRVGRLSSPLRQPLRRPPTEAELRQLFHSCHGGHEH